MVDLSVKNVPEELAQQLRDRAERNNRSLQGELLTILEQSVKPSTASLEEVQERLESMDLRTEDESVELIRELRDAG